MVEVAQRVEALAGVEPICRRWRLAPPPLPERAVALPRHHLPTRVRQRARRPEVVALHVPQCLRIRVGVRNAARCQQLALGVLPLREAR